MSAPITRIIRDGVIEQYDIGFTISNHKSLEVYLNDNLLSFGIGYEIEGDLVVMSDPGVSGDRLTFIRNTELKRLTDFDKVARFEEKLIDNEFDNVFRVLEDSQIRLDSFIAIPPTSMNRIETQLPLPVSNGYVKLNSKGDAFEYGLMKDDKDMIAFKKAAEEAATSARESADEAIEVVRKSYQGSGYTFPTENLVDGTLFYYEGNDQERGLYIHFLINGESQWSLISEEGPQGPQGPVGPEGPIGVTGATGATGPVGPQGPVGATPNSEWDGSKLRFQQGNGTWGEYSDLLGPEGPQGIRGPQGVMGPMPSHSWSGTQLTLQQGDGTQGESVDLVGPQGPQGIQGIQGPIGMTGPMGSSFHIDASGLITERSQYDNKAKGFSFYATDFQAIEDNSPRYQRFNCDGVTSSFELSFTPDGQQSLIVMYNGVQQGPDNYSVLVNGDSYTLEFSVTPTKDTSLLVREVTLSTGYGAVFLKNSDNTGDWSKPIPFGKGPRGDQGERGPEGIQGPVGLQGERGPQGEQGPQGLVGIQGPEGKTGPQGARGPEGPKGVQGDKGIDGAQGPMGETGPRGPEGPQGKQGIDGIQGPRGDRGYTGTTGPAGPAGPVGPVGPQGAKGPTGNKGSDGADGRSSSGKIYSRGAASYNKGVTVGFDTVNILGSQAFARNLVISKIGIQGEAQGNGTGRASAYVKATGSFGTVTSKSIDLSASNNSTQSSKTLTGYLEIPPLFLSIPANTTGMISLALVIHGYSIVGTASFAVTISPTGWWLAELYPASTELG